jgi:molybdopterin adenylyltransferase
VLGLLGTVGMIGVAVWWRSVWMGALAVFVVMNSWNGLQHARKVRKFEKLPRRVGFACPNCKMAPLLRPIWKCDACKEPFDTFETGAVCPQCGHQHVRTICPDCKELNPRSEWVVGAHADHGVVSSSFVAK